MPEMNGLQLYDRIQKLGLSAEFIFLTTMELPEIINSQIHSQLIKISKNQPIKIVQKKLFQHFKLL